MRTRRSTSVEERFFNKVKKTESCWIWIGANSWNKRYGCFGVNGKTILAHRWSYETFCGPLKNRLVICHSCNNKKCVKPAHLYQDTQFKNMMDAKRDGILNGAPRKSLCSTGHSLTDENLYVSPKGERECLICKRFLRKRQHAREALAARERSLK